MKYNIIASGMSVNKMQQTIATHHNILSMEHQHFKHLLFRIHVFVVFIQSRSPLLWSFIGAKVHHKLGQVSSGIILQQHGHLTAVGVIRIRTDDQTRENSSCPNSIRMKITLQREIFEGENFRGSVRRDHFAEKTFAECENISHRWVWHASNFVEKTFTGGSKSMKCFLSRQF